MRNTARSGSAYLAIALTLGICFGTAATARAQADSTKYQVDDAKEWFVLNALS